MLWILSLPSINRVLLVVRNCSMSVSVLWSSLCNDLYT